MHLPAATMHGVTLLPRFAYVLIKFISWRKCADVHALMDFESYRRKIFSSLSLPFVPLFFFLISFLTLLYSLEKMRLHLLSNF